MSEDRVAIEGFLNTQYPQEEIAGRLSYEESEFYVFGIVCPNWGGGNRLVEDYC